MKKLIILIILAFCLANTSFSQTKKIVVDISKYTPGDTVCPGIQPEEVFIAFINNTFYEKINKKTGKKETWYDPIQALDINFKNIEYKTKRMGESVDDVNGFYFYPVFVQKSEFLNKKAKKK